MANPLAVTENVISRRIGDDIVIVMDDGLSTHVLNKTAAFIWEMCDGRTDIETITNRLYDRFEVSCEQALADVRELIEKLMNIGIIKLEEEKVFEYNQGRTEEISPSGSN